MEHKVEKREWKGWGAKRCNFQNAGQEGLIVNMILE